MATRVIRKRDVFYKSKTHTVTLWGGKVENDGTLKKYFVVKSSTSSNEYHVTLAKTPDGTISGHCDCDWGKHRKVGYPCSCSHVQAALKFQYGKQGMKISVWNSEEDARKQRAKTIDIGDGCWITLKKAPQA